jgi:hypothetical protein
MEWSEDHLAEKHVRNQSVDVRPAACWRQQTDPAGYTALLAPSTTLAFLVGRASRQALPEARQELFGRIPAETRQEGIIDLLLFAVGRFAVIALFLPLAQSLENLTLLTSILVDG